MVKIFMKKLLAFPEKNNFSFQEKTMNKDGSTIKEVSSETIINYP